MGESWRPVWNYEGRYRASSLGRVFSDVYGKLLLPELRDNGYLYVRLTDSAGKRHRISVNSIVLAAFTGGRPRGLQCRHLNGDKTDNRIENLSWGTAKENAQDDIKNGFWRGSGHNRKAMGVGIEIPLAHVARHSGINLQTLRSRIGATVDRAEQSMGGSK